MNPIYKPKGAAKEYGDYALNIYTGCPHNCFYCFAPSVLRREKEIFHNNIRPRDNIVEEVKAQLERTKMTGKLIHLCFTCDPYPKGCDSSATREIIKLIKKSGNHVQILTKNGTDAIRDFDLLDGSDWFGITYAGYDDINEGFCFTPLSEPNSDTIISRINTLFCAHKRRIKTWVSMEPVLNAKDALNFLEYCNSFTNKFVDKWKIGKLNYHPSDINWKEFGEKAEALCKRFNVDYYIKDALRKEMDNP